jgi:predicted Zn-dependent protease
MSRFNFDKLDINEDKNQPINPMQGRSFLELLLQESTEGEALPEDFVEEPIGEIPIPDRKKRFKFLRFPKLKAMLDQLEQEPEDADAYVIMDNDANQEEIEQEVMQQWDTEKRDDTEEFLNNIEDKLKSLGRKGRATAKVDAKEEDDEAFEKSIVKSITEDEELVSETLANILAMQGKNKKAIKMYQALSLKFPEKSRFFAQKINELK